MRFVYTPGREFDDTEMPSSVTMFGVKFIERVPTEVLPGMFKNNEHFDHAIRKLSGNQYFEKVNDEVGTVEVLTEAPKKRGRPARQVEEVAPVDIEDVA